MFRRSRFSARPNVGTVGRGAAAATATPQETPPANQEASETPTDASESNTATNAVVENRLDLTSEKAAAPEDGNDQNGEGTSSSAAVQRRKRFSVKPKVAPGRPPTLSRTPKSPIKSVSDTPVQSSGPGVEASPQTVSTRSGNTAAIQGLQSPRRRRSSEGGKSPRVQSKPTLVSSENSEPSVIPPAEDSPEQTHLSSVSSSQSEKTSGCQVKEAPPVRHPEKVPPSLPDREANELSEKAKTLISSKTSLSVSASAYSLSRLLNDPSDLQRLVKAQKLRELLRQERCKEKNQKRARARSKEYTFDPAKMTMRDLIHYIPTSNPMSYDVEDSTQENETVIPPSPEREASPEPAQEPEAPTNNATNSGGEEEEDEDDQEEEALMVPQVKVAEDGSLIIDEESLTVEVQRAKGPNPAQDRDPIFERGSTTTYSSFRKGCYSKPWFTEETDMFFLAVSMVGTDFSMICQLFPHRARSEIKNKFKKEERLNSWRIDKAFKERRKLDIEYFSKLLEKVMEVQMNRKKLKSLARKNTPRQRKRKASAKKRERKLSNVEEEDEEDEEDEDEVLDLEEEGEKENEDVCSEGDVLDVTPKKKRKKRTGASTEERRGKKSKAGSAEQGESGLHENAHAALSEDNIISDASPEKSPTIKPAKLSRARAPKPTLPLGRKRAKKTTPSTKPKDAVSNEEDGNGDGSTHEVEVIEDAPDEANERNTANEDVSDEDDDDVTVKPPRPTRYGRVPKPVKPLNYSDKEDGESSASETPASAAKPKPKITAKRGRASKQQSPPKSKKPKLVTLRASQSEFSDGENEGQWDDEEAGLPQLPFGCGADNSASGMAPTGLHSLQSEISEVDDSMVELDILASMPDVLGISAEVLCPDSSYDHSQHETDTTEPCEHQLDLLVDVIDLLSTEHTEVSEEQSYNEAAQTLLTIGNVAHITQPAQSQEAVEDCEEGTSKDSDETIIIEDGIDSRPTIEEESAPSVSAQLGQDVTTESETVEVKASETVGDDMDPARTSFQENTEEQTSVEVEAESPSNPESSNSNLPQTRKGRLSKMKPKPNLAQMPRTAQSKSRPEVSTGDESHAAAPREASAATTDAAEISSETQDSKVNRMDEPSHAESIPDEMETSAAVSDQTSSEVHTHLSAGVQFEQGLPSTVDANVTSDSGHERLASSAETSETRLKDPLTCESTEVNREAVTDSAPDKPTHDVSHAGDPPVGKKEDSEVDATCQSRRGRLQKVKPNLPQTSRPARFKAQTTKPVETKSSSDSIKESLTPETVPGTPDTDVHSAPKQNEHDSPVVAAAPAEDELRAQEECNVAPTCQTRRSRFQKVKPNVLQTARAETSEPQPRKDLNLTSGSDVEPQPECSLSQSADLAPNVDGTPKELDPNVDKNACPEPPNPADLTSSSFEEKTPEDKSFSESRFDAAVEQNIGEPGSASEISDEILPAQVKTAEISSKDTSTPDSSVSESQVAQESNARSTSEQFQTGQDDDSASGAASVKDSASSQEESQSASTSHARGVGTQKAIPKPVLPQISHTLTPTPAHDPDTSAKGVEEDASVPSTSKGKRGRFPKVKPKPNLPQTRTIIHEPEPAEDPVAPTQSQSPGVSQPPDQSLKETSSRVTTEQPLCGDQKEKSDEFGQGDCKMDRSAGAAEPNTRQVIDPAGDSSKVGSTESIVLSTDLPSLHSEANSSLKSTDDVKSELTDSSQTSKKAPQARRGRLIKPKPTLGGHTRRLQPQEAKDTNPSEPESGSCSLGADTSADQKLVPELRPDTQEAIVGVTHELCHQGPPPKDIGSSPGSLVKSDQSPRRGAETISGQIASTSTEGIQSHPMLQDMLPVNVPSDPDEPFFILSLTEIPVPSSGEAAGDAAEPPPLPLPTGTDTSVQQPRVSGAGLVSAGERAAVTSTEMTQSADTGLHVKDKGTDAAPSSDPDPSQGAEGVSFEPQTCSQPASSTGRRAKSQVKPSVTKRKQSSEALVPEEAESAPSQAGTSLQPEAFDRGIAEMQKESSGSSCGVDAESPGEADSGSGAQTTRRIGSSRRGRAEAKTAPTSDPPPRRAAPSRSKAKAPPAKRKQSSEEPAASTSRDVVCARQPKEINAPTITPPPPPPPEKKGKQTSDASPDIDSHAPQCPAEISSVSLMSSSQEEDESIGESQYFLSDIFTEVEEE